VRKEEKRRRRREKRYHVSTKIEQKLVSPFIMIIRLLFSPPSSHKRK